jgi:hypothetical protein
MIAVFALAMPSGTQTSSPTIMTPKIMRGPDWARLRTAMPDIIAGRYQGGTTPTWNAAA